ncbi:MAG: hypothetical protein Q9P14_18060 [candidate division KSB1 bacterium]|nr:hypothetical protein [candidate division KSB1 bacterium]
MRGLILAFGCLLGLQLSGSFAVAVPGNQHDYELRRQRFLQTVAEAGGLSFATISARLALGREIEQCRADFLALLESPRGDMFYSLPIMGTYLHGYTFWTEEIHRKAREVWRTYLPYRGDTENHWVMWHTALLLAAQTWPDLPASEWANGRSSQENYEDAREFLEYWFRTTATMGQGEFDSPDYMDKFIAPLCLLYDFAADSLLRLQAEMALHWLLADYAIDYLDGAYTGGHSRIYDARILDPMTDSARGTGYLFFGAPRFPDEAWHGLMLYGALSSYRVPDIIRRIANDRSRPFFARERKRVRNIIRFGRERNPPVYKANYMSRHFSLGSVDGGLQQPIQLHTWDVTYLLDDGRSDQLFSLHPYYSAMELAMFFPEPVKMLVEDIVKSKTTYSSEDKWTGGSPYERTFQHQNTLIVLYDLAPDTPYRHIDYYFPKTLSRREVDSSGWIFAQGGKTLIAVRPFRPGQWREEETAFRFRSPHLKNGHVTVAFEAEAFSNWDAFKAAIRATRLDLSALDSRCEVSYITLDGDTLRFRFPDQRRLNGRAVDLSQTPLFDSPYLQGNDGVLRIMHGGETLILDFNKPEIHYEKAGE